MQLPGQIYRILTHIFVLVLIFHLEPLKAMTPEELKKYEAQSLENFIGGGDRTTDRRIGPPITSKLFRGTALIYNCKGRHFACVSDNNFDECKAKYEEQKQQKRALYDCYAIRQFETQEECFNIQLKAVHRVINRNFCSPGY